MRELHSNQMCMLQASANRECVELSDTKIQQQIGGHYNWFIKRDMLNTSSE